MIVPFATAPPGGVATPPKTTGCCPGCETWIAIASAAASLFAACEAPAEPVPSTSDSPTTTSANALTARSMRRSSGLETALDELAEAGAGSLVGPEALIIGVARIRGDLLGDGSDLLGHAAAVLRIAEQLL